MSLELIAFISPLIGVSFFFIFEKLILKTHKNIDSRVKVVASLEAINLIVNTSHVTQDARPIENLCAFFSPKTSLSAMA